MKTLILDKQPGRAADGFEAASGAVSRRSFLAGVGLVACATIVKPVHALPGFAYGDDWKESVCDLVGSICPEPVAGRIREAIYRAEVSYVTPSADFHSSFSSPRIINAQIRPEATYGSRFFEFERLPFYDSRNPCRRSKDLNLLEIERILNEGEREQYGGVVSPCSERRPLASCGCEWDTYLKTAESYEEDPDEWDPLYTRNFTDGKESYLGFAVRARTNVEGRPSRQLFLSPDSV